MLIEEFLSLKNWLFLDLSDDFSDVFLSLRGCSLKDLNTDRFLQNQTLLLQVVASVSLVTALQHQTEQEIGEVVGWVFESDFWFIFQERKKVL